MGFQPKWNPVYAWDVDPPRALTAVDRPVTTGRRGVVELGNGRPYVLHPAAKDEHSVAFKEEVE